MAIALTFEPDESFLRVRAIGDWDAPAASDALARIREVAVEHQHTRIMIDCMELSPPYTEFVRYETGESIARILSHLFRTVVIYPSGIINKFAEDVAVNRGANLFVTEDQEAGLKWLLL